MPTDWAVVTATFIGPIAAVGITLWYTGREDRKREARARAKEKADELFDRRLKVFRTLMATRQVGINPEHVNALNLIEVDFYRCDHVESAWKEYKDFLFGQEKNLDPEKRERLLSKLLFEIGKILDFDIPAIDIYQGGYAPSGWAYRDELNNEVLEFFRKMHRLEQAFPVYVHGLNKQLSAAADIDPENEIAEN